MSDERRCLIGEARDGAHLAVPAHEQLALAGIDFVTRERIDFNLLHSRMIKPMSGIFGG